MSLAYEFSFGGKLEKVVALEYAWDNTQWSIK